MDKRKELIRLIELAVLLAAIMCIFLFLLYDLQIVHRDDYRAKTVRSVGSTETVPAARGTVSDCYGRPLITNQVVYQVTLDVSTMGDRRNEILLKLIHIAQDQEVTWPDSLPLSATVPCYLRLGSVSESQRANYVELAQKLDWKSADGPALLSELRAYYKMDESISDQDARLLAGVLYELSLRSKEILWSSYVFATGVDIDFISAVREHSLAGVNVSPATTRKLCTTYAAHLLGRTGLMDKDEWKVYKDLGYAMNETVGKDGVEKAFESILRGDAGTQVVQRNTNGKLISQTWKEEPSPGGNIRLTIDLALQQKVEDVLAEKLPTLTEDVRGGAAVVMDVHSGAVLSMASYPTYDHTVIYKDAALYKEVSENPLEPFNNRATMGLYAPGSTYKMMVASAALEEGIIQPNTLIQDTGIYKYYKSPQPACWIYRQFRQTHGKLNVSRAIEVSCNVFFYDVGRRLGIHKMDEYAQKFGLGQPTGIEIPEKSGVLAGPEYTTSQGQTWYEGSVMSAAIGQENNQFTPLQLASYVSTLANGGTHYAAHLLKSVQDAATGATVDAYQPQALGTVALSESTQRAVKKGMVDLTTTGSLKSYFKDLPFQVAAKTGSAQVAGSANSNAVFVCYAPADDPQVAIALVAEQGGSGSDLAGLAADILNYHFTPRPAFQSTVRENTLLP